MRVLICGSRTFSDRSIVWAMLDGLRMGIGDDPDFVVIEGQCPYGGADEHAEAWAKAWPGVGHDPFPAHWERHGHRAGPIRNQQMLDEGKPDIVVAFVDKPLAESRGTNDMVTRAEKAGIHCYVLEVKR